MDRSLRNTLIFHGAIVMLLGLLVGFPFTAVVLGKLEGEIRAWRMAHLEGILNGLLLLAVAGVFRKLDLSLRLQSVLVWSLLITAYANVVASVVGAFTQNRGLELTGPPENMFVAVLFIVAVVTVIVAVVLVAKGALGSGSGRGASRVPVDVEVSTAASMPAVSKPRPRPNVDAEVTTSVTTSDGVVVEESSKENPESTSDSAPSGRAARRRAKKKRR